MFKKIALCLLSITVLLGVASIVGDGQRLKNVQAQELKQHVWFYSMDGMDYWITGAKKQNDNTYGVSVNQTCNGKMGTFHIYDVKYEGGLAYTSHLTRISGNWSEWEHSDFADAMWKACVEYF